MAQVQNTIAEYDFPQAVWNFLNGESISIPSPRRDLLDLCMRNGKTKQTDPGALVYYWEQRRRIRSATVVTVTGTAPDLTFDLTAASGDSKYFAIGDVLHIAGTTSTELGSAELFYVTGITDGDTITVQSAFHGTTAHTLTTPFTIVVVGSAMKDDLETYTTTIDQLIGGTTDPITGSLNSIQTFAIKRKVAWNVSPAMFEAIVQSATQQLLDFLDGSLTIGKCDSTTPQGSTATAGARMMTGLSQAFSGTAVTGLTETTFKTLLETAFRTTPAYDLMVCGRQAMKTIWGYADSPERLTYFRGVSGCSCGGGKGGARTAFYDSAWGKLEIVVSPYLQETSFFLLKADDLSLVLQQPPQLVMLPRTDNGFVFMMTCSASLEYRESTLWQKGVFA